MASAKEAKRKHERLRALRAAVQADEEVYTGRWQRIITLQQAQEIGIIKVVFMARVTRSRQDETVQARGGEIVLQQAGIEVVAKCSGVENGKDLDEESRPVLYEAVELAEQLPIPAVAVAGLTRLVRADDYHASQNPECRASVERVEELLKRTGRVIFVVLNSIDATPPEDEQYLHQLASLARTHKFMSKTEQKSRSKLVTTTLVEKLHFRKGSKRLSCRKIASKLLEDYDITVSYRTVARIIKSLR